MGVFHVFKIAQMLPNRATRHKCLFVLALPVALPFFCCMRILCRFYHRNLKIKEFWKRSILSATSVFMGASPNLFFIKHEAPMGSMIKWIVITLYDTIVSKGLLHLFILATPQYKLTLVYQKSYLILSYRSYPTVAQQTLNLPTSWKRKYISWTRTRNA